MIWLLELLMTIGRRAQVEYNFISIKAAHICHGMVYRLSQTCYYCVVITTYIIVHILLGGETDLFAVCAS